MRDEGLRKKEVVAVRLMKDSGRKQKVQMQVFGCSLWDVWCKFSPLYPYAIFSKDGPLLLMMQGFSIEGGTAPSSTGNIWAGITCHSDCLGMEQ